MKVRHYKPSDKPQLQYICGATADKYFQEKKSRLKMICAVYNDYFTTFEPENIFVATDENDKAVGYIICSSDYALFKKKMWTAQLRSAVKNHPSGLLMIAGYMFSLSQLDKDSKTHLHIDILPEYQKQGGGKALIGALRNHLKENGIEKLSVCGIEKGGKPFQYYTHYGFRVSKNHGFGAVSLEIDC